MTFTTNWLQLFNVATAQTSRLYGRPGAHDRHVVFGQRVRLPSAVWSRRAPRGAKPAAQGTEVRRALDAPPHHCCQQLRCGSDADKLDCQDLQCTRPSLPHTVGECVMARSRQCQAAHPSPGARSATSVRRSTSAGSHAFFASTATSRGLQKKGGSQTDSCHCGWRMRALSSAL